MFITLTAGCIPAQNFTAEESRLINSYPVGSIMRLFVSDEPADTTVLRRIADPVDDSIINTDDYKLLLLGMLETVNDPQNLGVGIAAPQVGVSKRIIAVQRFDLEDEPFGFYLNPEISAATEETVPSSEGCLSVPGQQGTVLRHKSIRIKYNDPITFELMEEEISGFTAIIFQHEIDHLNGVLFTDKTVSCDGED